MKAWLKKRSREGSSWGGLGLLAMGLSELFKAPELGAVGGLVADSGIQYVNTGDWRLGVGGLVTGLVAMFLRDKGDH